eukprot:gene5041-10101_t
MRTIARHHTISTFMPLRYMRSDTKEAITLMNGDKTRAAALYSS